MSAWLPYSTPNISKSYQAPPNGLLISSVRLRSTFPVKLKQFRENVNTLIWVNRTIFWQATPCGVEPDGKNAEPLRCGDVKSEIITNHPCSMWGDMELLKCGKVDTGNRFRSTK